MPRAASSHLSRNKKSEEPKQNMMKSRTEKSEKNRWKTAGTYGILIKDER